MQIPLIVSLATEAMLSGAINIVDWLFKFGIYPNTSRCHAAEHVGMIAWLITHLHHLPNNIQIDKLISEGYLDVIKNLNISYETKHANIAYRANRFDLVEWFASKDIYPDCAEINKVCEKGDLKQLIGFYSIGVKLNPTLISSAIKGDQLEICRWLHTKGVTPKDKHLHHIISTKRTRLIDWMIGKGFVLDQIEIDRCWRGDHGSEFKDWIIKQKIPPSGHIVDELLKVIIRSYDRLINVTWMLHLKAMLACGGIPNQKTIDQICEDRNYALMEILANYKFFPDINSMKTIDVTVIEWAKLKGIIMGKVAANLAAKTGKIDVLKYLANDKIFPDSDGLSAAFYMDQVESMRWLVSKGAKPSKDWITMAKKQRCHKILEWVKTLKIE